MSNALTLFDSPQLQLPSHIAKFLGDNTNIEDRATVPSLTYEGKVWTISKDGEKTKLVKKDPETGDELPLAVMRMVVLDYAKRRGRSYYPGAYDPTKVAMPECWSDDGVEPHPSASDKKADKCANCPLAVKGSKVSEQGKAIAACSQHRMLAVVPAQKLDMTPLRLKLAVTSDYDKESPELDAQHWFAFSQLLDFLRSKNVPHTASLVIKAKFDHNAAYPKVKFSPDRWLNEQELAVVAEALKSEEVAARLKGTYTNNGVDGTKIADDDADGELPKLSDQAKAKAPAAAAKPKVQKAAPPPPVDDDDEDVAPPAAAPKAVTGTVMDDDDDMDLGAVLNAPAAPAAAPKAAAPKAAAPKAAPAAAAPVAEAAIPADLQDILSGWDE